jgi:hypothetical protein
MGVLVDKGGDEERTEELARNVFAVADADVTGIAGHAGAVSGVGVEADREGGFPEDGDAVEGVSDVADGEPGFVAGGEGFVFGAADETLVPVFLLGNAGADCAGVIRGAGGGGRGTAGCGFVGLAGGGRLRIGRVRNCRIGGVGQGRVKGCRGRQGQAGGRDLGLGEAGRQGRAGNQNPEQNGTDKEARVLKATVLASELTGELQAAGDPEMSAYGRVSRGEFPDSGC